VADCLSRAFETQVSPSVVPLDQINDDVEDRVANIEARKYGTQKGGVDESSPQAKLFLSCTLL